MKLSTLSFFFLLHPTTSFLHPFPPPSTLSLSTSTLLTPVTTTDVTPPLAPLTIWGDKVDDIKQQQEQTGDVEFTRVVDWGDIDYDGTEMEWISSNAMSIKDSMVLNGAVIFRNFNTMKTQPGFVKFYETLGMNPCLDPLHSVSARPTIEGKGNAVYEAVNKESRKNFFIGMHNEFVGTRAPRAAAFVCFKAAEEGGEFLIADGRKIFKDLNPEVLERLYRRSIRYSVMELPFFGWVDNMPSFMQGGVMGAIKGIASAAINAKVDFSVELLEQFGGYDNTRLLQARAPSQPPVVRHPVSGEPTWFCNVHSHSSVLRKQREELYGKEKFEDGASQINKSDMYYGDDGDLSPTDLSHLDAVTKSNIQYVKMTEGDVVLLDNYKCMHGRNVFDGTRKHGVAWFGGWEGEEEQKRKVWKF